MTTYQVESAGLDVAGGGWQLSPARVEAFGFLAIAAASVALIVLTVLDVQEIGDDNTFHVLDGVMLLVIVVAAGLTHRAFRNQ